MTTVMDTPRFLHSLLRSAGTGVGEDAEQVDKKLAEARVFRHRTTARPDLIATILSCFDDHRAPNWDGEGAEALKPGALRDALRFVETLPEFLPIPEVLPEPRGTIALEWFGAPNLVFVASFQGGGTLVYVGVFGKGNVLRGAELLRGTVPERVVEFIRRIGEPRKART